MATTLTLQNSINFAGPILKNAVQLISGMEPALTAGNIVLTTMLGPPMRWRFNRKSINFSVNATATDYVQALPDFGFVENVWLQDTTPAKNIFQLNGDVALPKDSNQMRPTNIAPQYDDNQGNITFRLNKIPDANYSVYLDYQKKATLLASPASPWGIIPDEFCYIFDWGYLAAISLLVNDSRFPIFEQYWISRLLGAQDGLSDQARNIFLGQWANFAATLSRGSASVNSGVAGRGK